MPVHPETKAKMNNILAIESKLDLSQEYKDAFENIEKFTMKFLED